MSIQGFHTAKGLALAAKIAAGTKLTVTRVTAGGGETAADETALAQEKQTLTAGAPAVSGQSAVLPVTLAEADVSADYDLTELGVYAQDPEAGEILYQVFRLTEPAAITAGGADTFRFYLRQTVGTAGIAVTCSPAGLLVDEDLEPVRERVMAAAAPSRAVTLAPGEVAAYIAALPRMQTELLTIKITAGTVTDTLDFTGFYGCGNITLQTASGSQDVTLAGGVAAYRCAVKVNLIGMAITGGSSSTKAAVSVNDGGFMQLNSCTLTAGTGITKGVATGTGSQVYLGNCSISGFATAIFAAHGSMVMPTDTSASGNTVGAQVWAGGIVLLGGSTPDALGGSSHVKNGGMIVKANGTLL